MPTFTVELLRRKEYVRSVEEAKAADTRARRVAKVVEQLQG